MPRDKKIEDHIHKNKTAFKELSIRMEGLNREVQDLLESLNVTPQQLSRYVENPDNFVSENWEEIQKIKQEIDAKMERSLSNIKNPQKTKQSFENLRIQPTWLHVR